MNKFLTDKVNNLSASATLAMAAKARELRSKGVDVIGLSLGEPDFNYLNSLKRPRLRLLMIIIILTHQLMGMLI